MQALLRQARRLRHRLRQPVRDLARRVGLPPQLRPVSAARRAWSPRPSSSRLDGTLWENASISLQRIALGFFFGSLVGIPLGLAIGSFGIVRRILEPYTEFLRFIPATALITVAVIWFGIGEGSKIFLIIYTTVFIVIINTAAGVSAVAPNKIRAARSLGANRAQVFLFVALPATVPYILTGMRLAMGNSFVTIIAAELVAANAGLGKMIWDARLYMLVDQIFVALLVLGLLGFTADRLFRWGIYAFAGRFSPVT